VPREITRIGPGAYSTQFTLERTIGDLGQEIRQPSNPFANLARRALQRSQINALKSMYPELDSTAKSTLPRGSRDIGNGYIMQHRERHARNPETNEHRVALQTITSMQKVCRWGRLRLPNGQVARSLWSEGKRASKGVRISRNVKASLSSVNIPPN
jgi:hypothetical protein